MPIERDFLFDCSCISDAISYHFRDIRNRSVHERDCDLFIRPMSNVNMPIESTYATFYLLPKAMSVPSVTVYEIITYELHNVLHYDI